MANTVVERPDPDKLLSQVEAQERYEARGRLKVFLGYAGGVGKSFRMLDEGRRRRKRGEDVVVGAIQPKRGGGEIYLARRGSCGRTSPDWRQAVGRVSPLAGL